MKAAVLHDYLLHTNHERWFCDEMFKDALLSLGINKIVVYSMWITVRIFGIISENVFNIPRD